MRLPDAKQEEGAVAVVVRCLRACIQQFAATEHAGEETLVLNTDIGVALLGILRDGTLLLHGNEMLQLLGIRTAHLHVGVALLHNTQDALVKAEDHDCFDRREYLVLHVGHACLLSGEAEAIESQHIALAEMLQGDDGAWGVSDEFNTLELIVHQIWLPQSLPQNIG